MIRSAPSTDGSGPPLSATDPLRGLSEEEAERRRASGLGNEYRPPTSRGWWEILRQNAYLGINGPLIVISILLLLASRPIDAFLTAGPVLFNIGLGVYQEARAKQQLDRIALLNRPRATVVAARSSRSSWTSSNSPGSIRADTTAPISARSSVHA